MKHLQIAATVDPSLLPSYYATISDSPAVTELRVIDWNLAADSTGTLLYAIDGEADVFREAATETIGVEDVTLAHTDRPTSYALLSARHAAIPFFSTFMAVTARANLVVRKPLVYRDTRSYGRVVGRSAALQEAIDEIPDGVDVQIERIREFPSVTDDWTGLLSDRQQEAIETALRMGYYDQPREATHADIASELQCAPNTATTHLQKAEAKLVQTALNNPHTGVQ